MPPLNLNGQVIVEVKNYKYLGVHLTSDLKWDTHITTICHKSKKMLGLMYRRFFISVDPIFLCRLYLSLVHPILEYVCQVRDPYTQRNIKELESVQIFAWRVSSHCWNIGYEMLLTIFQLPSLSARQEYLRITTPHKIITGNVTFPSDILIPRASNRSTRATTVTTNSFTVPFAHTLSGKTSLVPRTLCMWNFIFKCMLL